MSSMHVQYGRCAQLSSAVWQKLFEQQILSDLKEMKENGISTVVDASPVTLGRDVKELKKVSEISGSTSLPLLDGGAASRRIWDHLQQNSGRSALLTISTRGVTARISKQGY